VMERVTAAGCEYSALDLAGILFFALVLAVCLLAMAFLKILQLRKRAELGQALLDVSGGDRAVAEGTLKIIDADNESRISRGMKLAFSPPYGARLSRFNEDTW
jgi:hypothetical protein